MPILSCYVTDETLTRLNHVIRTDRTGDSPESLAEAAIEEAALAATRHVDRTNLEKN